MRFDPVRVAVAGAVGESAARDRSASLQRMLPQPIIVSGYFDVLAIPNNTTFSNSAWFGLRSLTADELQGEFTLLSVQASLSPTDSAAAGGGPSGVTGGGGAGQAAAWGDTTGRSAAIVVGQNLDLTLGGWKNALANLPSIETNATGSRPTPSTTEYIYNTSFPSGKWNDTTPAQINPPRFYNPGLWRFGSGNRLDIALVCRGSQIQNTSGGTKYVVGYAHVACVLAPIDPTATLSE